MDTKHLSPSRIGYILLPACLGCLALIGGCAVDGIFDGNFNFNAPSNTNGSTNANTNNTGNGGGNGGDNDNLNGSGNGNDNSGGVTLVTLPAVTFHPSDVPNNVDPTSAARGGGTIQFSGGKAGVLGIIPLYFDDSWAWVVAAPGTGIIAFDNLDVRAVSFYFPQNGFIAATLSAIGTNGQTIAMVTSVEAFSRGDINAMFQINGLGASIDRLVIQAPGAATVAIDQLVLTVAQ